MGWSGGKDSTCGAYKHLYRGDLLKAVCYIPHFTEDIPLINKEHYEFIIGQAEIFTQMGGKCFLRKELLTMTIVCLFARVEYTKGKSKVIHI